MTTTTYHHHHREPHMHRESIANASTTTTTCATTCSRIGTLTSDDVHAIALVLNSSESLDARMDAIDAIVYGHRTPMHTRIVRAMATTYRKLARSI